MSIQGEMSVDGDETAKSSGVEKADASSKPAGQEFDTPRGQSQSKEKDLPQVVGTRDRPYTEGDFASYLPVFQLCLRVALLAR